MTYSKMAVACWSFLMMVVLIAISAADGIADVMQSGPRDSFETPELMEQKLHESFSDEEIEELTIEHLKIEAFGEQGVEVWTQATDKRVYLRDQLDLIQVQAAAQDAEDLIQHMILTGELDRDGTPVAGPETQNI